MTKSSGEIVLADNDLKLFFCHIPKTAGMTLRGILENHFHEDEILKFDQWPDLPASMTLADLNRFRLIRGHFRLSSIMSLVDPAPLAITMLRHPVDRIVSAYKHIRQSPLHPQHEQIGGAACTLDQFLSRIRPAEDYSNLQVSYLSAPPPAVRATSDASLPARDIVRDPEPDGGALDRAKEALDDLGFFGITERFADSMAMLGSRLGWEPLTKYEDQNKAKSDSDDRITRAALDRVMEANQLDLELYTYASKRFEERYSEFVHGLLWKEYADKRNTSPRPERIDLIFDGAIHGYGWRNREMQPQGRFFRWTGPGACASLHFAVQLSDQMEVKIGLVHVVAHELLDHLIIKVNGQEVAYGGWYDEGQKLTILKAEFPGALLNEGDFVSVVEFCVPSALRPIDVVPGSRDTRKLGIAVAWVSIAPVSD
ncbi:MAG: sulfotransferase family 2 domain-containing protein [Chloroflexi bacterium]|nr:sulfotransferase family 2 domain-containing protein [Chloroflexota bacterium]